MEGEDGIDHYSSLHYHGWSADNIYYIWPMQLFVRYQWRSRHWNSSFQFQPLGTENLFVSKRSIALAGASCALGHP